MSRQARGCVALTSSLVTLLACAVAFNLALGHRNDYLGHFLAGCGGTAGLQSIGLLAVPRRMFSAAAALTILALLFVALCIGLGCEYLLFSFARADEIDIGNQSIGGALGSWLMLCGLPDAKPHVAWFLVSAAISGMVLLAGFHYAFK